MALFRKYTEIAKSEALVCHAWHLVLGSLATDQGHFTAVLTAGSQQRCMRQVMQLYSTWHALVFVKHS